MRQYSLSVSLSCGKKHWEEIHMSFPFYVKFCAHTIIICESCYGHNVSSTRSFLKWKTHMDIFSMSLPTWQWHSEAMCCIYSVAVIKVQLRDLSDMINIKCFLTCNVMAWTDVMETSPYQIKCHGIFQKFMLLTLRKKCCNGLEPSNLLELLLFAFSNYH